MRALSARSLWLEAQIRASPAVQRQVILPLHQAKEMARHLTRPRLPIYQWTGQGVGGPLTVCYTGLGFARAFLKNLLFAGQPDERYLDRVPFWAWDRLGDREADITIVEGARNLIRRLPTRGAFVTLELVDHILDARGTWDEVEGRFRRTVRRNELRLLRRYGYKYSESHDERDFDTFYRQMYLPTMNDRHGDLSSPTPMAEARQYFRHGWLSKVEREGEWVAGIVSYCQHDTVMAMILGVKDADERLIREGAGAALYHVVIQWANERGLKFVHFGGTGARLESGLFQHKRKWGMTISIPPELYRRIWIQIHRLTPAVIAFLKANPFITVDEQEKLHGLILVQDLSEVTPEVRIQWEERYMTSGLSSLRVCSLDGLIKGTENVCNPALVVSPLRGS